MYQHPIPKCLSSHWYQTMPAGFHPPQTLKIVKKERPEKNSPKCLCFHSLLPCTVFTNLTKSVKVLKNRTFVGYFQFRQCQIIDCNCYLFIFGYVTFQCFKLCLDHRTILNYSPTFNLKQPSYFVECYSPWREVERVTLKINTLCL